MSTVTQIADKTKQPFGGYIKPSKMDLMQIDDGNCLNEKENVDPSIVGQTVDYLIRLFQGAKPEKAFEISLIGAEFAQNYGEKDSISTAKELLSQIKGLDNDSIISACRLASFDVWYRNPINAKMADLFYLDVCPNRQTIKNIKIMVERGCSIFEKYGPVIGNGLTFLPPDGSELEFFNALRKYGVYGGYTKTINKGDCDLATKDTLWDIKVSKNPPTSKHTLQLLLYWVMGQHSGQKVFKSIKKIGIFNPRLNRAYTYEISNLSKETIEIIEKDVICY